MDGGGQRFLTGAIPNFPVNWSRPRRVGNPAFRIVRDFPCRFFTVGERLLLSRDFALVNVLKWPLAEIGRRRDAPSPSMIGVSYTLLARLRQMVRGTLHPKSEGLAA
jgi:hypothetical protein